jgi:hypothetical protein
MKRTTISRVAIIVLLALFLAMASVETGWAQQPAASPPSEGLPWLRGMAIVAGAVGSIFYIPFKVGLICPGAALVAGGNMAVTGGSRDMAERLLRIGCTGTFLITPEMVRGQEEFQGSGAR